MKHNKDKIVNCERMKVRKMDTEKGITNWVPSNLLVVTFNGPRVPEKVNMYGGLMNITVRPYVESVIQCFQCYGFGHWKDKCKKDRACVVCGERFHGRCDKKEMCVNCKGNHRANDRKCEVFKRQEEINKTMTREGITSYVARKKEN